MPLQSAVVSALGTNPSLLHVESPAKIASHDYYVPENVGKMNNMYEPVSYERDALAYSLSGKQNCIIYNI